MSVEATLASVFFADRFQRAYVFTSGSGRGDVLGLGIGIGLGMYFLGGG